MTLNKTQNVGWAELAKHNNMQHASPMLGFASSAQPTLIASYSHVNDLLTRYTTLAYFFYGEFLLHDGRRD